MISATVSRPLLASRTFYPEVPQDAGKTASQPVETSSLSQEKVHGLELWGVIRQISAAMTDIGGSMVEISKLIIDLNSMIVQEASDAASRQIDFLSAYLTSFTSKSFRLINVGSLTSIVGPLEISEELQSLFDKASGEVFEDGMESGFARGLTALTEVYGAAILEPLAGLIFSDEVDQEVAYEALRWLGNLDSLVIDPNLILLLEHGLRSRFIRLRAGAMLGLSSLGDPAAIPYLELAIARELVDELRRDMMKVLKQLRELQLD